MEPSRILGEDEGSATAVAAGHRLTLRSPQAWFESFGISAPKIFAFILALALGAVIWRAVPPEPLGVSSMHFLGTLAAAVVMWTFGVFDEYIVALVMLVSWLVLGVAPSELAVAGFAKSSWFFILGALGMAAAMRNSGLLNRVVAYLLSRTTPNYTLYTVGLTLLGWIVTPSLPEVKARLVVAVPVTLTISERLGFQTRSNGSAGLMFSSYVGFSQLTFMFLTGASTCFVAWGLLPDWAKLEFGWSSWALAALPAGIVFLLLMNVFILRVFRLNEEEKQGISENPTTQIEAMRPMTRSEWVCLIVAIVAPVCWISKPLHGVSEAWVALTGLVIFLVTGVLDKKAIKSDIDWGFLLYFGVIYSMAGLASYLRVDKWLMSLISPMLGRVSEPVAFLVLVLLAVYFVRFFLGKSTTIIVLGLPLLGLAAEVGIHPGIVVLTMLIGVETWFLPYQTPSYLLAYQGSEGKAFSHGQGRKLMAAKFLISFLAVAVSVPYWSWLGFIEPKGSAAMERSVAANATVQAGQMAPTASAREDMASFMRGGPENRVAKIQTLLTEFGYDLGPIDGILGARTIQAIQEYQRREGLEVHGRPSRTLEERLWQQRLTQTALGGLEAE